MKRFLVTTFALCTVAGAARAQQHDAVAAEALFRDARDAFKKGDYATACPKFAESNRLDPATGTLFNLADCEERAGKLASAWLHFRDVIDALRTNPGDERHGIATQHANALETRLPRLRVRWGRGAFPNAVVKRDGVELGAMSIDAALPTDPGPHTVEVSAPARKNTSYTVQASEGKTTDVEIAVGDPIEGAATKPDPTTDQGNQPHVTNPNPPVDNNLVVPEKGSGGSSVLPIIGWITVVLGAGGLIVGGATGGVALGDKSTADSECSAFKVCTAKGVAAARDGAGMADVSTAMFVVGGVLLAGGLTMVLVGGSGGKSKSAKIPLWLQGRF